MASLQAHRMRHHQLLVELRRKLLRRHLVVHFAHHLRHRIMLLLLTIQDTVNCL